MRDFVIAVNYVFYRFYRSRGDGMAEAYSMVLAPLMLLFNSLPFLIYYRFIYGIWPIPLSKTILIVYLLPVFAVNYWFVYWDDKFFEVFSNFSQSKNFVAMKKAATWYIIVSISIVLLPVPFALKRLIFGI